jgi:hypothetical protein
MNFILYFLKMRNSHSRSLCDEGEKCKAIVRYAIVSKYLDTQKEPYREDNNQWDCLQLLSIDLISRKKLIVTHTRLMTTTYHAVSVVVVIEITSTLNFPIERLATCERSVETKQIYSLTSKPSQSLLETQISPWHVVRPRIN